MKQVYVNFQYTLKGKFEVGTEKVGRTLCLTERNETD